jgi:hypothetical protein
MLLGKPYRTADLARMVRQALSANEAVTPPGARRISTR